MNKYRWMIAHEFLYACDRYSDGITGCGTAVPDQFPEINAVELANHINGQEFRDPNMGRETAHFCLDPLALLPLINIAKMFSGSAD